MTTNRLSENAPATFVAVCTYAVMAGFFTQSGVILAPAAGSFGRSLPDTAAMFSYLIGGNLVGILASLGIFELLSIRSTLVCAYLVMLGGIALLWATHVFSVASLAIGLVGFGGGLGLATGAVILSKTYAAHQRATAFLGTDCMFSVTGFVVPPVVAIAIVHGCAWQAGYAIVGAGAVGVLLVAARVCFPVVGNALNARVRQARSPLGSMTLARIGLFGLGLALYLCGQTAFLLWSPNYVTHVFGLSSLAGAKVVSSFWGPSIFGLIAAAVLVMRFEPRAVLVTAASFATLFLVLVATTSSAAVFFAATLGFGCTSTSMYKLMISIGSEQVAAAPPQLLTFLLLSGSVGGVVAPFASGGGVRIFGPRAGPCMALGCYAAALIVIVVALALEKAARRPLAATAAASLSR